MDKPPKIELGKKESIDEGWTDLVVFSCGHCRGLLAYMRYEVALPDRFSLNFADKKGRLVTKCKDDVFRWLDCVTGRRYGLRRRQRRRDAKVRDSPLSGIALLEDINHTMQDSNIFEYQCGHAVQDYPVIRVACSHCDKITVFDPAEYGSLISECGRLTFAL